MSSMIIVVTSRSIRSTRCGRVANAISNLTRYGYSPGPSTSLAGKPAFEPGSSSSPISMPTKHAGLPATRDIEAKSTRPSPR